MTNGGCLNPPRAIPWTLPDKLGPAWFVVQVHRCGSVVNPASWVWTAREAMEGQCAPQYHPHLALTGSISLDLFFHHPKVTLMKQVLAPVYLQMITGPNI